MSPLQPPPAMPALGELATTLGLLTLRQLHALCSGGPPGDEALGLALVERHVLAPDELADLRAFQRALGEGQPLLKQVDRACLALVPMAFALRHQLLPVRRLGRRLVLAFPKGRLGEPEVTRLLDEAALVGGLEVLGWPADPVELRQAAGALLDPHSAQRAIGRALATEVSREEPPAEGQLERTDAPIADLATDLVARAVAARASDLHLDPGPDGLVVRLRVDGVLADQLVVPRSLQAALVTRIKLLAGLDIAERRHPQDGRYTWRHQGHEVDLRVAIAPTRWGEMVVIRLLRALDAVGDLAATGLLAADLARYQRMVAAPHGIVLVTGPTGSGKSTTLYGTLLATDRVASKVISVEDPIEFGIERVDQIQVNPAIGLTFAQALRSILRLDPDVIFVGEIRDEETMEIAMHAAMTGHLVLSTLHANGAVATLERMHELGASGRQIATSLRGVVAQRLVRRLCEACRRPLAPGDLGHGLAVARGGTGCFAPVGCERCGGTGYRGRLGVFEVLALDGTLAEAVAEGAGPTQLQALARAAGMATLLEDGLAKAALGCTSLAEIDRVLQLPA